MQRRSLLRRSAAIGALGLAGCLGQVDSPGAGDAGNVPPENGTPGNDPDGPDGPVTDVGVETLATDCADELGSTADVAFDEDENAVRIGGILQAGDPCHEAVVDSISYDEETDVLEVALGTKQDGQDGCVECVGKLEFEATVSFEDRLPETVSVRETDVQLAHVERGEEPETPDGSPSVEESTFEVTERSEASVDPMADVTFDGENDRIVVTGTIHGSNGCQTAVLGSVEYDADADEATVAIVTEPRPGTDDQVCTQAIVAISYEATVTFSGGTPERATVTHDGDGVTTAGHGSATASAPREGQDRTDD